MHSAVDVPVNPPQALGEEYISGNMRRSTALLLSTPSFAACVCASTLIYPNILGAFLAPLIFGGIALVIVGLAIASKHHESTPRSVWTLLTVAGSAQMLILIGLGTVRG